MKRSILLFALFVCCLLTCCSKKKDLSQIRRNDTLELYFEKANNDSLPFKVRYDYAKKAEAIVMKEPNDSMGRVNYFRLANRYWNMLELEEYKKIVKRITRHSNKKGDIRSLAKAYAYSGEYFYNRYLSDSAYIYFKKSAQFYFRINDMSNAASMLVAKATLQYRDNDLVGAQKSAFEALKVLKNSKDYNVKYSAYNVLGFVFADIKEFSKSLEYHSKALSIASSVLKNKPHISTSLHNIGLLYQNYDNHKKAIQYFNRALEMDESKLKDSKYAIILDNLGYSKLSLQDFQDLPNLFYESFRISDSLKLVNQEYSSKLHLSQFYLIVKDTTKAKEFAQQVYVGSVKTKNNKYKLLSLKELINTDYQNAKKYSLEYIIINDSLQLAERKNANKFARIEYETEELALENTKLTTQRKTIVYAASSLLLLVLSVFLFWYQKSKSRELQLVRVQQQANEEIYKLMLDQHQKLEEGKQSEKARIAKELHDGIMGRLSSIRLNLFALEKKTDEQTINKCIGYVREIQDVEKEIKAIAYDLGNNLFSDNINFETMVRKLFAAIESHSDIRFRLSISPDLDWNFADSSSKMQIYRILQESLQNIDKYARAKNVSISMKKDGQFVLIEVQDDGIGFDKKKIRKGFGLGNMKKRAKEIGGKMMVRSEIGVGTTIILVIPIKQQS